MEISLLDYVTHEKGLLNKNLMYQKITGKTKFHKQILESWYKLIGTEPQDQEEIANPFIVYNQYIKINDKPINNKTFIILN